MGLSERHKAKATGKPASSTDWKAKAHANKAHALSQRTRDAYADQWRWFEAWCTEHNESPLPADTTVIGAYLTARAAGGWKVSSLSQGLAGICHQHVAAGHASPRRDPELNEMWMGLRKSMSSRPEQKAPLSADWLREMLDVLPDGLHGARDRALLMIGFAGGFRRSELAALGVDDVQFHPQGVELLVRKSKTDQAGRGQTKVIAYGKNPLTCPVRALEDWLELACITAGPVFRSIDRHDNLGEANLTPHSIAKMVKDTARRAGLDADRFSGHSLRAGFVTAATLGGADEAAVMDQTGHRSVEMVRRYTRRLDAWSKPASSKLGL
jgi:integrase